MHTCIEADKDEGTENTLLCVGDSAGCWRLVCCVRGRSVGIGGFIPGSLSRRRQRRRTTMRMRMRNGKRGSGLMRGRGVVWLLLVVFCRQK